MNSSNIKKIVFSYPRLKDRLEKRPEDKTKAQKILKEIAADPSPRYLNWFSGFLTKLLTYLYEGLELKFSEEKSFEELSKENHLVLVPNHQSHADYVAINYVIYKNFGIPLYVAGGKNLNIFLIGHLFRKCGCFFIRRAFANDVLYRLVFEAYLYYLLMEQKPIEFFLEGGRSRTGRLLAPRFGLFQMIMQAYGELPEDKKKPIMFLPVSIVHEYVPEQKTLTTELLGKKKKKENILQFLKIFKIFSYEFGTIHIHMGKGIFPKINSANERDFKEEVQNLAYACSAEIAANMRVTPASLLAMVLLENPKGAMKWDEILAQARHVLSYCRKYHIILAESLKNDLDLESTLYHSLDLFLANNKVDIIGSAHLGHVFYSIKKEARLELLYVKNSIVHHFIIPWAINQCWASIFTGTVETPENLLKFFDFVRKRLLFEFQMPFTTGIGSRALKIVSDSIGRNIRDVSECFTAPMRDSYKLLSDLGVFTRTFRYIQEGDYLALQALKVLNKDFYFDDFKRQAEQVFESEMMFERFIHYPESYSIEMLKRSLKYFEEEGIISQKGAAYHLESERKFNFLLDYLERALSEKVSVEVNL